MNEELIEELNDNIKELIKVIRETTSDDSPNNVEWKENMEREYKLRERELALKEKEMELLSSDIVKLSDN